MEAEIAFLENVKDGLAKGIETAFRVAKGAYSVEGESWVDLAITVKAHGHYSMPAADKVLSPKEWAELIDETIARLRESVPVGESVPS